MKKHFLLWAMVLGCTLPMFAADFEVSGIYYNILPGNRVAVTLAEDGYGTYYGGYKDKVTIPSEVTNGGTTYSVTQIGVDAFYGCTGVTEIELPNSIDTIADYAFYGCTGLTSITIPCNMSAISPSAFTNCSNLTAVYWNAKKLTSASSSSSPLPSGVTSVVFGSLVEDIPASMCYGLANLSSVSISKSITSIGESAFTNCPSLASITVAEGNALYHSTNNCLIATRTKTLVAGSKASVIPTDGSVTSIGEKAFYGSGITSITIPNTITEISESAFQRSALTSITIPSSVTSIGVYAFYGSTLTSATIEHGLTSISDYTFEGCTNLKFITIPSSVTRIYSNAFYGCTALEKVDYTGGTITSWCSISMSSYANPLWQGADFYMDGEKITNVAFECNPGDNFSGCTSLQTVSLPSSVTSIYNDAFANCTNLHTITIPNSVTSIGGSAFKNCSSLKNITISSAVTGISYYTFLGCTSLQNITIPSAVTYIRRDAFNGCTSLQSITIPRLVTSINGNAFANCTALESVNVKCTTPPTLSENVFPSTTKIIVSCGMTDTYWADEEWAKYLNYDEAHLFDLIAVSEDERRGTVVITQSPASCDNKTAIFEAQAEDGYEFEAWNDGNTDNPRTVEVTDHMTYTASFINNGRVDGVSLNKTSFTLGTGSAQQLVATITPDYAINKKVNWSSDNESIATVDSTGLVLGIAVGETYIHVTTEDGGFTSSCKVTVEIVSPTSVSIDGDYYKTVTINDSLTLTTTIKPVNANKNVIWSSSDTTVATINSRGVVFGLKEGYTTITVTTEDGNCAATCSMTVYGVEVDSVRLSTTELFLETNNTYQLSATIYPAEASVKEVRWFSYDESVATVDSTGLVTAVGYGETSVYIEVEDYSSWSYYTAYCNVRVLDPTDSLVMTKDTAYLDINEWDSYERHLYNLTGLTIYPNTAYGWPLIYTSSDTSVIQIEEEYEYSNYVYANPQKIGDAYVKVATPDGRFADSCLVRVVHPVYDVYLNRGYVEGVAGMTYQLTTEFYPEEATIKDVAWSSSNDTIATVDANGLISFHKPGSATITVTTKDGGHTATCNVFVQEPITHLGLTVNSIKLRPGDQYILNTIVAPEEAKDYNLLWRSSNEEIVDAYNGYVYAYNVGDATITVSTLDYRLPVVCHVVVMEDLTIDSVIVAPGSNSVYFAWSEVENASEYVFIIYADRDQTNEICRLTFNEKGHLVNLHFSQRKPASNPDMQDAFSFTVTGLEANTTYNYTLHSYDNEDGVITQNAGTFTTTDNTTTGLENMGIDASSVYKVFENGTIYIIRGGEKYTVDGIRVM